MDLKKEGITKNKILLTVITIWIFAVATTIFISVFIFSSNKESSKKGMSKKSDRSEEVFYFNDQEPELNIVEEGYVVTDGKSVFFKNQYDNNKLYSYYKEGDNVTLKPIADTVPGTMYYYEDYIYYTGVQNDKNVPGSIAIYRAKTDGSGEEMLMPLEEDAGYASLDALVEGKLYFSYYRESLGFRYVYLMDLKSLEPERLDIRSSYTIGQDPIVAVTKDAVYFKELSKLKRVDLESKEEKFCYIDTYISSCIVYGEYIYYTSLSEYQDSMRINVNRVSLDGSDKKLIYTTSEPWAYDVKLLAFNNKIFILTKSEPDEIKGYEEFGNIRSCEPDGSELSLVSARANLMGVSDNALYYAFYYDSEIKETDTLGKKFETLRRFPTYKRDVSAEGEISEEYVFLDPKDFNKGWVSYNTSSNFYNPKTKGYSKENYFYYDENGELYKNSWKNIDGKNYYFGEDGRMYSQEYTPEGYFVGEDGSVSDFEAPFKFLYSEYPDSKMIVKEHPYLYTDIIDRDNVYELTNTEIFATKTFSEEEVAVMKSRKYIYIEGPGIIAAVAENEGYNEEFQGECIKLKQSKYLNIEFKLVKPRGSYIYTLKLKEGDSKPVPLVFLVYSGSAYVTKDATVVANKESSPDKGENEISFKDYCSELGVYFKGGLHFPEFHAGADILDCDTVNKTYAISRLNKRNKSNR